MKVGDLCKVTKALTHTSCQQDDLVLISRKVGSVYVEGINLKTLSFHHYLIHELEVISESR
jgi:hypothetical protein